MVRGCAALICSGRLFEYGRPVFHSTRCIMQIEPSSPLLPANGRLRAIMLSCSAIADDPRVRRMGDYLHSRGWDVVAIGLPGARSAPPDWKIIEARPVAPERPPDEVRRLGNDPGWRSLLMWPARLFVALLLLLSGCLLWFRKRGTAERLLAWSRRLGKRGEGRLDLFKYVKLWFTARKRGPAADHALFSRSDNVRAVRAAAIEAGHDGLWVANDWLLLPVAYEGVKTFGGVYVYDSHEYATQEYAERLAWRLFQQPLVQSIERRYLPGAAVVTTVSPGISRALQDLYQPATPVATLRNLPVYQAMSFRPCGDRIQVLYHGVVAPGRGLEASIRSVVGWPETFDLTIRGPGDPAYLVLLSQMADEVGVKERVTIAPPVPTTDLVRAASMHDIGLLAAPCHSMHNALSLPNKFFEYLMAGLALCVSELPEMADILADTGAGLSCGDGSEAAIAEAMRTLNVEQIHKMKRNSLEAAKTFHYQADAAPIEQMYATVLRRSQGPASPKSALQPQ